MRNTSERIKDVRPFLGHAGFYRKFYRNFSAISCPLSHLLSKDAQFEWTNACEETFSKLKVSHDFKSLLEIRFHRYWK